MLGTVAGAYRFALRDRLALARLAFGPVLALALLIALGTILQVPRLAFAVVALVAQFAVLVIFAIACQRRFLLAGESDDVISALTWRRRHWTYLSALLLIVAITMGSLALVFSVTPSAGRGAGDLAQAVFVLGLVVAAIYGNSRLAMMLPAAAIDEPVKMRLSWQQTDGNGWRLVLINIIAALPPTLAHTFVALMFEQIVAAYALETSATAIFLGALANLSLSLAGLALSSLAVAASYRALVAARG